LEKFLGFEIVFRFLGFSVGYGTENAIQEEHPITHRSPRHTVFCEL